MTELAQLSTYLEGEVNVDRGGEIGPRGIRGGGVDQIAAEGGKDDGAEVADEPLDAVVAPEFLNEVVLGPTRFYNRN